MGDISLAASAALLARTLPFLLLRVAVYCGIGAAFVVAAIGGGGIGGALGAFGSAAGRAPGAFWGAAAGLAFVGLLVRWLREYLLYFVEAGHAAALALALDSRDASIAAGMTALQRRYRDAAAFLAAERLVRGTVHGIAQTAGAWTHLLPPGIALPRNMADAAARLSLGFAVKALLALAVRRKARNLYSDLQALLVLLAQNNEPLLRSAALLAAASFAATFAIFIAAIVPVFALLQPASAGAGLIALAVAMIVAWTARQACIEPLAVAAFIEVCARTTADQEPDPDWDARLADISTSYREIKAVAAPAARGARRGIVV